MITPDVCVERKSVPDLLESMRSGRLLSQMTHMKRFYKTPVLLIEFSESEPFGLVRHVPGEISKADITTQMVVLVLAFPAMRIVWSRSTHAAVQQLVELKRGKPEPNRDTAAAVGTAELAGPAAAVGAAEDDGAFNYTPYDMLKKMPGITNENIRRVSESVDSIYALTLMSREELAPLLGGVSYARELHDFFHTGRDEGFGGFDA